MEAIILGKPFTIIKTVVIALDAFLLFGFVLSFVRGLHYRHGAHIRRDSQRMFTLRDAAARERWDAIQSKHEAGTPEAMRIALIEADAYVDGVLRRFGLAGEHMADRLSRIDPEDVSTLDRLWRAHRVRNNIVHTPGFTLSAHEAKRALDDYEAFLTEVGIL